MAASMSFAALGFLVFTTPDAKERPSLKDGGLALGPRISRGPCFSPRFNDPRTECMISEGNIYE